MSKEKKTALSLQGEKVAKVSTEDGNLKLIMEDGTVLLALNPDKIVIVGEKMNTEI